MYWYDKCHLLTDLWCVKLFCIEFSILWKIIRIFYSLVILLAKIARMKIVLPGSIGFVGGILSNKSINGGYQIKMLARSPEKLEVFKDRVAIIKEGIFEPLVVERTIEGSEAYFP